MISLKNQLKKLYIIFFTRHPYKIRPFEKLYAKKAGVPLDVPETTSDILNIEKGATFFYPKPPICINGEVNYRYIGEEKRYLPAGLFKEPDRYIYSVSKGCIIGPLGLCYNEGRRAFIDESAKEWTVDLKYSPFTNMVHYPVKEYLNGITLSCLTNGAEGSFYHFLIEAVVKLYYYGAMLSVADHILFNGPATEWKLKWLRHAGVDIDKIKWVSNASHFECEQLLFTSRLINDQQISHWCISGLKSLFSIHLANDLVKTKKILWITRKGLKERNLQWENEILATYPEIEAIDLSELDVSDTISKFQSASHIIGPHGAGLSNIYLCSPGTKILEIYPQATTFQPYFHRMAAICKLEHYIMYLDFNNKDNPETGINAFTSAFVKFIW
jgi:hypothetical protein